MLPLISVGANNDNLGQKETRLDSQFEHTGILKRNVFVFCKLRNSLTDQSRVNHVSFLTFLFCIISAQLQNCSKAYAQKSD